jgi:hypothetical protein
MAMSPLQTNRSRNGVPNRHGGRIVTSAEREIFHELMNQLTAINLCTSRLRYSSDPSVLSMLERIADSAVQSARRLAAEIYQ